jgi:hypothetical protein
VERILKGKLPKEMKLYGNEGNSYVKNGLLPGRHLVFLSRDGQLFIDRQWNASLRPITNNVVDWYATEAGSNLEPAPLDEIVKEINAVLEGENKKGS